MTVRDLAPIQPSPKLEPIAEAPVVLRQLDRLAYEPNTWKEAFEMAQALCKGRLLPEALQTPEAAVTVLVLGRELGLTAMQSIRGIHVVKGKPCLSAQLMVALVRQSGLAETFDLVETTAERAAYVTRRRGSPRDIEIAWTIEQARVASLLGNNTWKSYPAAMLRARASAELCRAVYPDVVAGLYDPDEVASIEVREEAKPERTRRARKDAAEKPTDAAPAQEKADPVVDRAQVLADLAALETLMGGRHAAVEALGPWPTTPREGVAYLARAVQLQAGESKPTGAEQPAEPSAPTAGSPTMALADLWKLIRGQERDAKADVAALFGKEVGQLAPTERWIYGTLLELNVEIAQAAKLTVQEWLEKLGGAK